LPIDWRASRPLRTLRRACGVAGVAGVIAAAAAAAATPAPVVLLRSRALPPFDTTAAAFRAACADPVLELSLDGTTDDIVARAIAAAHPAVVVALGRRAAMLVHERLPQVPLVYAMVRAADRIGLAGVLKDLAPEVRRVGVVFGRDAGEPRMRLARAAARAAGVELLEAPIARPAELSEQARALAARADAFWLPADSVTMAPEVFRYLLDLSISTRRPLVVFSESLVRAGALAAVTPDYRWVGGELARLAHRARTSGPTRVPVVPLERTRIAFNPAVAQTLALPSPPPLANLWVVP